MPSKSKSPKKQPAIPAASKNLLTYKNLQNKLHLVLFVPGSNGEDMWFLPRGKLGKISIVKLIPFLLPTGTIAHFHFKWNKVDQLLGPKTEPLDNQKVSPRYMRHKSQCRGDSFCTTLCKILSKVARGTSHGRSLFHQNGAHTLSLSAQSKLFLAKCRCLRCDMGGI